MAINLAVLRLIVNNGIPSPDDFIFDTFEEPTQVVFGKEQSTYKHLLIGGGRIIDVMGAGDPDLTWSGYFVGTAGIDRARYLEGLAMKGKALTLTTDQFVKQVIISRFTYGFHYIYPVQYTITVQVIQDLTLPVNFLIPGDLTDTIISALVQASDIATLVGDPNVTNALALANIAAQAASPFNAATAAQVSAALAAAQNALAAVNTAIAGNEAGIFGQ